MTTIGIVGAGVAGLHLGLHLRRHGVAATIYTNRTAEQVRTGRLPNSVAHHHVTLQRERMLGVDHWPGEELTYASHYHHLNGPQPLFFRGDFTGPSRAIDYRIYLPALMGDFTDRGGELVVRDLSAADVEALTEVHDLVVVASGKGDISALFPRRSDKSPYDRPQRKLAVGLWHGVRRREPAGVEMSIDPGQGELLAIPMESFSGQVTALLFENVPDGDLAVLTDQRQDTDPDAYRELVLAKLRAHHPSVHSLVDPDEFRLQGPLDVLQGAVTPVLREDYVRLPNGRFLLSLGDVHQVVDPVCGQGANSAAYSAHVVADAVAEAGAFDELFCRTVARRRAQRSEGTTDWVNTMIASPTPPHVVQLLVAMSQDQGLCDEFTENFNHPDRQWDLLATPERVERAIARHTGARRRATAGRGTPVPA